MSDATITPTPAAADSGLIARLASQRAKFKQAWQAVQTKVGGLETRIKELAGENERLAVQADTSLAAKKVDELTGKLRQLTHRQAFDAAALKAGAQPSALEDLWTLSGVKADSDQPDAEALAAVIAQQKAARGWAFAAPDAPPDPNAPPPPRPAPGSGQGGTSGAPVQFSEDQLNDPKFVMLNFEKISAAANERAARGEI